MFFALMTLLALGLGAIPLVLRSREFKTRALGHRSKMNLCNLNLVLNAYPFRLDTIGVDCESERVRYERAMFEKYVRAARYPWLPIEPDPPMPPPALSRCDSTLVVDSWYVVLVGPSNSMCQDSSDSGGGGVQPAQHVVVGEQGSR